MSNFEEVKEIGNQYYKDGDFNSALEKYNECLIHCNNVDKDSKGLRYKIFLLLIDFKCVANRGSNSSIIIKSVLSHIL